MAQLNLLNPQSLSHMTNYTAAHSIGAKFVVGNEPYLATGLNRAIPLGGPINDTTTLKVKDGAVMPWLKDLGCYMTPLSYVVCSPSGRSNITWSSEMFGAEAIANIDCLITHEGYVDKYTSLTFNEPNVNTSNIVQYNTPQKVLTREQNVLECKLYSGHANNIGVAMRPEVLTALTNIADVDVRKQFSRMFESDRKVGHHLRTDQHGASVAAARIDELSNLFTMEQGLSYVTFFVKAWLDFFDSMTLSHSQGVVEEIAAFRHPTYVYLDIGPEANRRAPQQAPVRLFGGESQFWNHLATVQQLGFFVDCKNVSSRMMQMIVRYATSWPPTELAVTLPNGKVYIPTGRRYRIPGATNIYMHLGTDLVPRDGFYDYGQYALPPLLTPLEILSFITNMATKVGRWSDVRAAYEIACERIFCTKVSQFKQSLVDDNTLLTTAMMNSKKFALPRDETIMEYFRPVLYNTEPDKDLMKLLTYKPATIYEFGRLLNIQLAVARSVTYLACNITAEVLDSRDTGNAHDAYLRKLGFRERFNKYSIIDATFINVCGHMYGWEPNQLTALMVDITTDYRVNFQNERELDITEGFYDKQIPINMLPYNEIWMCKMIPDVLVFPTSETAVKWDKKQRWHARNARTPSNFRRVGYAIRPIDDNLWIGDGGSMYSLQHYAATNGNDDYLFNEKGEENDDVEDHITVRKWQHPEEWTRQEHDVEVEVARLPAPFGNYLYPGSAPTYDAELDNTISYGVLSDLQPRQNVGFTAVSSLRPQVVPYITYSGFHSNNVVEREGTGLLLFALKDRFTGKIVGLSAIDERMYTVVNKNNDNVNVVTGPSAPGNKVDINFPDPKRQFNKWLKGKGTTKDKAEGKFVVKNQIVDASQLPLSNKYEIINNNNIDKDSGKEERLSWSTDYNNKFGTDVVTEMEKGASKQVPSWLAPFVTETKAKKNIKTVVDVNDLTHAQLDAELARYGVHEGGPISRNVIKKDAPAERHVEEVTLADDLDELVNNTIPNDQSARNFINNVELETVREAGVISNRTGNIITTPPALKSIIDKTAN